MLYTSQLVHNQHVNVTAYEAQTQTRHYHVDINNNLRKWNNQLHVSLLTLYTPSIWRVGAT